MDSALDFNFRLVWVAIVLLELGILFLASALFVHFAWHRKVEEARQTAQEAPGSDQGEGS